jgi:transcriptional regulator with XRE-family HTH domain
MPRHKADWFGPRLKAMREAAGLSQAELGKRAGVVGSQINKLELGVNQPTLATAVALAHALGVGVERFVVDTPAEAPAVPHQDAAQPGEDQGAGQKVKRPKRGRGKPAKGKDNEGTP